MDECHNYKTLSEADRAQGNVLQDNKRCDQLDLTTGWYRFQGAAGDQIPDKCVDTNRCGTSSPGWLSGAHPTVAEGVVTRKVCYHWWDNCCFWSNNIKVKNCSDFYVYELQKPPFCDLRYCGNAGSGKFALMTVSTVSINSQSMFSSYLRKTMRFLIFLLVRKKAYFWFSLSRAAKKINPKLLSQKNQEYYRL